MLESVMKLPRCDDNYKIHAWLSDRIGSHRNDRTKYVFTSKSVENDSLVAAFHEHPIPGLPGSVPAAVPEGVVKFRARLNPTRRFNGKRVPVSESDLSVWLQRQLKGVEVVDCVQVDGRYELIERKRNELWVWTVLAEGELRITDKDAFARSMLEGAGRYKGYGWGMVAVEGQMAYRILGL